jgi:hypothetical protein
MARAGGELVVFWLSHLRRWMTSTDAPRAPDETLQHSRSEPQSAHALPWTRQERSSHSGAGGGRRGPSPTQVVLMLLVSKAVVVPVVEHAVHVVVPAVAVLELPMAHFVHVGGVPL